MSEWIKHVKDYANQHGCSYKDALKGASSSYRAMKGNGMRADFVEREKNRSRADELKALKHAGKMVALSGYGVGRRNKFNKWVGALGARDMIDAGFSKGTSTISGMGVNRRKKYNQWVGALGAKDMIDAGFSKGASTIRGSGMTKKQAIASLQMANAMYGDQAMSQLKKHRRKLSGTALYAAGESS